MKIFLSQPVPALRREPERLLLAVGAERWVVSVETIPSGLTVTWHLEQRQLKTIAGSTLDPSLTVHTSTCNQQ
jgi:hypothetical protein